MHGASSSFKSGNNGTMGLSLRNIFTHLTGEMGTGKYAEYSQLFIARAPRFFSYYEEEGLLELLRPAGFNTESDKAVVRR